MAWQFEIQAQKGGFSLGQGNSLGGVGHTPTTVDSKTLEHECGTICAGFPSLVAWGVGGRSCANFLASAAKVAAK